MTHEKPRQREDGKWDYTYTSTSDENGIATGYCYPWQEFDEETKRMLYGSDGTKDYEQYAQPKRDAIDKFHSCGHDTPEEAIACYRQYLLDFHLRFHNGPEDPRTLHQCAAENCFNYTAGEGEIADYARFYLCNDHRNRETFEKLFQLGGESWSY